MVSEWNSNIEFGCGYTSEVDTESAGGPYYIVHSRYFSSEVDGSEYSEYIKVYIIQDIYKELYPQLTDLLEKHEITVMFTLSDENGENTYAGIIDNEIKYFD